MLSDNINFAKILASFCVSFVIGYVLVAYKMSTKQFFAST